MSPQPADSSARVRPITAKALGLMGVLQSLSAARITYSIIVLTAAVYLLQQNAGYVFHGLDRLELMGARINILIRQGELWRFFTPVLLHEGFSHLVANMLVLYLLGSHLERYQGHTRFLILYLLAAFSGNVLSFIGMDDSSFSVGASTSLFGLIGAEAVFLYQNRNLPHMQARQAVLAMAVILVVTSGLLGIVPGRDILGHLGGLVGGMLFCWFAGPRLRDTYGASPSLLVDERGIRDVVFGAGLVLLLFGILAIWGMAGNSL